MYSLDEKINSRIDILSTKFKGSFCNCEHNAYLRVRLTLIPNNKIEYLPLINTIDKIVNYNLRKYYKRKCFVNKYKPSSIYTF